VAQRFDSWQRGIRRAEGRVFAGFCLVVALLQVRSLVAAYGNPGGLSVPAVAGVVFLLAAGARGLRGRVDAKDALAFTLLLALTAAEPSPVLAPDGTGGDANPSFFILAATFLAYIVTLRGPAVPAAISGAGVLYVVCSVVLGDRDLGMALDEAVLLATSDFAIWILFRQLEIEGRRADDAHLRTITEQGLAARISAEQRTTIAAQRTLHDRVLTALLLLLNARALRRSSHADPDDRRTLRDRCRQAADAVRALRTDPGGPAATTTDQLLHLRIQKDAAAAAASTGVTVRTRHVPTDRDLPVPGPVAEALCGAVAEALRNVGRHAGVDHADVLVTASPDGGLRVDVVDRGRGLPPGSAAGFGLRHSVTTRLREVGGSASVDASDAGGTRVTLRWSPEEAGRVPAPRATTGEAELTRVSPRPRTLAAEFSGPLYAGALFLAIRYSFESQPVWTDVAVYAGVLGYGVCCIVAIPWLRALRWVHAAGFVVLPALLAAGLYLAGPGSLQGFEAWVVGLASFPVLILAMARPLAPVLLLAGLESAVVATAAVLDPAVRPLDVLAPITQTPMFVGLLAYGVAAVRRVRKDAETEERSAAAALALSQSAESRQRVIETHYAWLHSDVRPFLDAVADGHLHPADGAVQRRASVLALAIRDELALPAQISPEVRQLIAAARDRGTRVRVRATDEWAPVPPELAQVLTVLAAGGRHTDITVSLPQEATPQLRVVVRPRLQPAERAAVVAVLADGMLEMDEDVLASIITFTPDNAERA
jgi:signal transduction histidine kinase